MIVEGQLQGGAAQGIGAGLMEEIVYDDGGQLLTGSLMDYAIPRADRSSADRGRARRAPLGDQRARHQGRGRERDHRGAAAIANAVEDALQSRGADILEVPITPSRVWQALRQ